VLVGPAADPAGAPAVGEVTALVASIVTPSRTTVGMGVAVASPAEGLLWFAAAVAVAAAPRVIAAAGLGVGVARVERRVAVAVAAADRRVAVALAAAGVGVAVCDVTVSDVA
jgi:hypothetical protein